MQLNLIINISKLHNIHLQAPSSLLEALEGHLANLEGRKPGSGGTTPTSGGHRYVNHDQQYCLALCPVVSLEISMLIFILHLFYVVCFVI